MTKSSRATKTRARRKARVVAAAPDIIGELTPSDVEDEEESWAFPYRDRLAHECEQQFTPGEQLGMLAERLARAAVGRAEPRAGERTRGPEEVHVLVKRADPTRTGRSKLPRPDVIAARVLTALHTALEAKDESALRGANRWAQTCLERSDVASPSTKRGSRLLSRSSIAKRLRQAAGGALLRLEMELPREVFVCPGDDPRANLEAQRIATAMAGMMGLCGLASSARGVARLRDQIIADLRDDPTHPFGAHRQDERYEPPSRLRAPRACSWCVERLLHMALVAFEVTKDFDGARDWAKAT